MVTLAKSFPSQMGYIVIGKSNTLFWDHIYSSREKPCVIYDPALSPKFRSVSEVNKRSILVSSVWNSSTCPAEHSTKDSKNKVHFIASWMKPKLDEDYCEHIYLHISHLDHVYLVGGGVGRWSGINNFMKYLSNHHPQTIARITPIRYFRLTDFPEEKLMEIFKRIRTDTNY